jgi:hypothetical protein
LAENGSSYGFLRCLRHSQWGLSVSKSAGVGRSYRMRIRYRIKLGKEERARLIGLTDKGKTNARKFVHARALLLCDVGAYCGGQRRKIAEVAESLGVTERTIERLKKLFLQEEADAALDPKPRKPRRRTKFDGSFEAHIIALAYSSASEGRVRWTVRLLAQKIVELKIAPSVSTWTVRDTLKKRTASSPEQILEDSADSECRFYRLYGRCHVPISPSLRSTLPACVHV